MPKVSIIILNWNGKKFLYTCLSSLKKLTYKSVEVVLVDNNSSDDSVLYVKKNFPWVKLVANKTNDGFAKGNNIGVSHSTGEYVLFLNNDTKVEPRFLDVLMQDFIKDPSLGCIQPQMRGLADPNLLDEAGAYITPNGFLYHYGYRKSYRAPQYRKPRIIYSAKGACMIMSRKLFDQVGRFDEDFFIFFEETDLCHRVWLSGYKVIYEPRSSIFHLAGGDTTDKYSYARRIYLTIKNMNMSFLQNFGALSLCTLYAAFLGTQVALLGYFSMTGKFYIVKEIFRAWSWIFSHMGIIMKKRKKIQKWRILTDVQIKPFTFYNPGLYYYYCLLFHAQKFQDQDVYSHYEYTK